jgi:uncharacterized OB-fold protein
MKGRLGPDTGHPDFSPFWEGCKEQRLLIPSCRNGHLNWPPRPVCQTCYEWNEKWVEVAGRGSLYSWTVVHKTRLQSHATETPYVVGVVELQRSPLVRMLGRCELDPATAEVGLDLAVDFHPVSPDLTLPFWRPVYSGQSASSPPISQ